jgi:hypothetical protein
MIAQPKISAGEPVIKPKKLEQQGIAAVSIVSEQYRQGFCFARTRPVNKVPQVEALLNAGSVNKALNIGTPSPRGKEC